MMTRIFPFLFLIFLFSFQPARACSMYKVTVGDKTMVGNNEDNWRTTPHIWFETAQNGNYGCAFVGSRNIGVNKYAAQSGMNEHGLTFSRLASYHPIQAQKEKSLKLIELPDLFLMEVLKTCRNIDEVYAKLSQYDRSCFIDEVFVYVEPSGKYLVAEPYSLILGTDPSYVQANYCPSITAEKERRTTERYRNGRDLLDKEIDTSWEFCTKVSNEMHVCRDKIGDGTLLTTIWNTKDLQLKLHFYHDYETAVSFDLKEELAKGDHQLEIKTLFPENEEFAQLESYVTPFNTPWLRFLLVFVGLLFAGSSAYFFVAAFRTGKRRHTRLIQLLLSLTLALGVCFTFVLTTTIYIYYFPAPYQSWKSGFETFGAYIPYLLSVLVVILLVLFVRKRKTASWSAFSKVLLALNASLIAGLFVGIFYWGLI